MDLKDFNELILRPSILRSIEAGLLDNAIQDADCQAIINADPELKKVVNERMEKLKC